MAGQRFSFKTIVILGGAFLLLVPALVASWIYVGALQREAEQLVAANLRVRGELAASQLARRLYDSWIMVRRYATTIKLDDLAEAGDDFTLATTFDDHLSWFGLTNVSGQVIAGSGGIRVGQSVSERIWFRRGLAGPYAGDVHDAAALTKLLGKQAEPMRFIDFATPVRASDGRVAGVLGAHLNWDWVRNELSSLSGGGIDVLLISNDRTVLFGPADLEGRQLTTGAAVAAGQAQTIVRTETWPDGQEYMTAVIPAVRFQDMPSFGWSVMVRRDLNAALGPTRQLARSFFLILGSAALVSLALLSIGASWLATPLHRLGVFAAKLADGPVDHPPYEETRYQEATVLSAALARLQSRVRYGAPAVVASQRGSQGA